MFLAIRMEAKKYNSLGSSDNCLCPSLVPSYTKCIAFRQNFGTSFRLYKSTTGHKRYTVECL